MSFILSNPNPRGIFTSDCVVRALSIAQNRSWEDVYIELSVFGFDMGDWGSSNAVWGAYLRSKGFDRFVIPNTCPNCYTIEQFCKDNPSGTYILATGTHVVAVIDGNYYDSWNSGNEVPIYYWQKVR
jgi:hypothetical protein